MLQAQLKPKVTVPKLSAGELLKEARIHKGISIAEISQQTFIKSYFLEALENNLYEQLPAPVYTVGYIRHYAKYLGLAEQPLIENYQFTTQYRAKKGHFDTVPHMHPLINRYEDLSVERFSPVFSQSKGTLKISEIQGTQPVIEKEKIGNDEMEPSQQTIHSFGNLKVVETIEGARKEALVMKHQAEQYADSVLSQLQKDIEQTLATIQNGRKHLKKRVLVHEKK